MLECGRWHTSARYIPQLREEWAGQRPAVSPSRDPSFWPTFREKCRKREFREPSVPFFAAWRAAIAKNFYINVASHYHILQLKKDSMRLRAVARPNGKQLIHALLQLFYSTFAQKCSFWAREIRGFGRISMEIQENSLIFKLLEARPPPKSFENLKDAPADNQNPSAGSQNP